MISPSVGDRYSAEYAEFLADAELAILRTIRDSLAAGIDAPEWERRQLARIQGVRRDVLAVLDATAPRLTARLNATLQGVYQQGLLSAYADAGRTLDVNQRMTEQAQGAIAALANQVASGYAEASAAILRGVEDVYRRTVADATSAVVSGRERRVDAVQRVLASLTRDGISSISTRGGKWGIANYTTMAVRTATARAAIAGHEAGMDELGLDLVVVHPGPRSCPTCDRWARMILARNGSAGTFQVRSVRTNRMIRVEVGDTLANARRGGWGHPNCRCGIAAYLPGVTDPKIIERPKHDAAGYAAQQRQREIERQIRAWKQREATALTPQAQEHARRQVRNWQGTMRDHLAENPDLKRQSFREQIGQGLDGNARYATEIERERRRRARAEGPAKPAEPEPSSTPKLDRLPRLDDPEAPADAGTRTNPRHALGHAYQVNCSYVVNAVELRARGFDVVARARPGGNRATGRTNYEMAGDWRNADGSFPTWQHLPQDTTARNVEKRVREIVEEWPVGARGFVSGQWSRQRSGHVYNVERTDDGVRYIEGQVHEVSTEQAAGYLRRMSGRSVAVLRTDNLDMTDALDDVVEANSDDVREAAAAAQALELDQARRDLAKLERNRSGGEATLALLRARLADPKWAADVRRLTRQAQQAEQYLADVNAHLQRVRDLIARLSR